ncbi:MAG: 1-(5-phosphoribosyl)-5-[(5-phosphoribosylamino)methylideneamino]imidazole-4-carboxamide isomerase [Gemmatimonadota bacterium]|nr:1-(5-phosphoribosyl)-5-[(5-phosphoribosylamino)methylideneamino]imidazole-4-carboxamide isomerase [Gemmatimonadota bacterium]
MTVYPAIDLLNGACVRLLRGSYDEVTRFSDDPVAVARGFVDAGARALHVVDLDGARDGRPVHAETVRTLVARTGLPVQVGGGIRSLADAAACLESGVRRVLLGTAAARDPEFAAAAVSRWGPDRVAGAVDVRDGRVVVEGWLADAGLSPDALLARLRACGIRLVLYTDTTRDGTLGSPDAEGVRALVAEGFRVIAAGGVRDAGDVRALRAAGAEGCVIGSALYRGTLRLEDALAAADGADGADGADAGPAGGLGAGGDDAADGEAAC